jgi:enoyl-CoA hydratase/carnithine racemase
LSRRTGKKPIIAAVNGLAYGGGCEAVVNCDLVFASADHASFGFPEVKRGVFASAGALPRIMRIIGKQRAMEMALTGRVISAREAKKWGFVNDIVEGKAAEVVAKAVEVAQIIAANSPDAVIVSRQGVMMGWEGGSVEEGSRLFVETFGPRLAKGANIKEGLKAFVEKRVPHWTDSKL